MTDQQVHDETAKMISKLLWPYDSVEMLKGKPIMTDTEAIAAAKALRKWARERWGEEIVRLYSTKESVWVHNLKKFLRDPDYPPAAKRKEM